MVRVKSFFDTCIMPQNENKEILVRLGVNLRRIRLEQKMSQERLEVEAEISKNIVGELERGEVNPKLTTFYKLAKALKVSFDQLLE